MKLGNREELGISIIKRQQISASIMRCSKNVLSCSFALVGWKVLDGCKLILNLCFLLFQDRTVRNPALLAFIQSKLIKKSFLPHSKVLHMLNVFIKCSKILLGLVYLAKFKVIGCFFDSDLINE